MKKEYWFWIIESIERRLKRAERPLYLTPEGRTSLLKEIQRFSDDDYESVSDGLTKAIALELLQLGVPLWLAIRTSWKWSD